MTMKKVIACEAIIPTMVSFRIRRISYADARVTREPGSIDVPSAISSSISSPACQKNKYGEMVVPKNPTTVIKNSGFQLHVGTKK